MIKMIKYYYCHYFRASHPIFFCNTISSPPNFVIKHQKRNNKTIECGGIAVYYSSGWISVLERYEERWKSRQLFPLWEGKGAPWPPGAPDMANHWVYSWHAANTEYTEHTEYIILSQLCTLSQIYIEHTTNISHEIQIKEKSIWPKSLFIPF